MLSLFHLFVTPFIVESQYRDAVLIYACRSDLAVIAVSGECRTPPRHTHASTIKPPVIIFQFGTVSPLFPGTSLFRRQQMVHMGHPVQKTERRHMQASPVFDMVSPGEGEVFVIHPPR